LDFVEQEKDTEEIDNDQEKNHVSKIIRFCKKAKSKKEILTMLGLSLNQKNHKKYLEPLIKSKKLKLTDPDNPNNPKQKYIS
jgi:ATP-dependent DNA helicase RecG